MKTVYTFVIITFIISMMFWAMGIAIDNQFSTIGAINDLINKGVSASTLWNLIFGGTTGFIIIMGGVAAVTAFAGADASIARVAGYTAFARWCLGLVGDHIAILNNVEQGCDVDVASLCSVNYYIVWFFGAAMAIGFIFALLDLIGGND